jgi:hypothetical protein
MINKRTNRLLIFENFRKIEPIIESNERRVEFITNSDSDLETSAIGINGVDFSPFQVKVSRFLIKLKNKCKKDLKVLEVLDFFNLIKGNVKEINQENLEVQLFNIEQLKSNAEKNHQTALVEHLNKEEERIKKETILYSSKYEFLEESTVVNFAKKANRDVKLDWIKNFIRLIPEDVHKKLQNAKDLKVFDNYVIMHFDPNSNNTALIKKEEEKKKDPILFGVMECSDRLYYIADWEDEFCNLTLKTILNTLNLNQKDISLTESKIVNHKTADKIESNAKQ